MPVPPPRLGSTSRRAWEKCRQSRRQPAITTVRLSRMLLGSGRRLDASYRQSTPVPTRSVATTAGPSKTIFCSAAAQLQQTTAPSSPVAVTGSSHAQLSPCPLEKPNLTELGRRVEMAQSVVVECLSGGVETLLSIAHIPFGPSALPCPPLDCIFRGHTRIPHASRQPCLYHAVGRSCDPHTNEAVCTTPSELRPSCLTRALLLRCILYYPPQCNGKSVT